MTLLKNISYVLIYKDPKHYCSQCGVVKLRNGDIVVVFGEERGLSHDDTGSVVLIRSKDDGESWVPSSRIVVSPCSKYYGDSSQTAVTQLSDGTLIANFMRWVFPDEKGKRIAASEVEGTYIAKSKDDGYTWESPIRINAAPMRWAESRDAILEMPDGALLAPLDGAMWARGSSWALEEPNRSFLARSEDKGEMWEYFSTIAYDPANIIHFCEPALARLSDGRLLAMHRTHLRPSGKAGNLYMTVSENDGASWSLPKRTDIWPGWGNNPAHLLPLKDGRVLLTYGYRGGPNATPPYSVRALVSEDGLTWEVFKGMILKEENLPREQIHIGYPSSIQLKDGQILTAYHWWSHDQPPVQYIEGALYELEG